MREYVIYLLLFLAMFTIICLYVAEKRKVNFLKEEVSKYEGGENSVLYYYALVDTDTELYRNEFGQLKPHEQISFIPNPNTIIKQVVITRK